MTHDEFNAVALAHQLPVLTAEQWALLTGTVRGRNLKSEAQESLSRIDAELYIRSCSDRVRENLLQLKIEYDANQIVGLAFEHGKPLFQHIHFATEKPESRQYLQEVGLRRIATTSASPPPYFSFPIYAEKAALTVAEAQTPSNIPTVNFEGAHALCKRYDWSQKIVFQLSFEEMIEVLRVLMRHEPLKSFKGHGRLHDKMMEISAQEGHYFIRLIQRDKRVIAVPVPIPSAIRISSLIVAQIKKTDPHFSTESLQLIKSVVRE